MFFALFDLWVLPYSTCRISTFHSSDVRAGWFTVPGFGFKVRGCGFRHGGFGFTVPGFGFKVRLCGFRCCGFGFTVPGVRVGWPQGIGAGLKALFPMLFCPI